MVFADDIAVVTVRKYLKEVTTAFSFKMKAIKQWMEYVSLCVVENKTEALLVTGRKEKVKTSLKIRKHNDQSQPSIHYLGVTINEIVRLPKLTEPYLE